MLHEVLQGVLAGEERGAIGKFGPSGEYTCDDEVHLKIVGPKILRYFMPIVER